MSLLLHLALPLLLLPTFACADEASLTAARAALESGMERLAAAGAVEVDFTETRRLAGLDRDLETPGTLWLADGRLRWQLGEPPRTLLVVDGDRFELIEGGEHRSGNLDELGHQRRMVELLAAVFGGERASLERQFDLTDAEPLGDNWRVIMTPRLQPVREAIGSVALTLDPDGRPLSWALRLADGTELSARFGAVETSAALDPKLFQIGG